jgi:ubiquinone/menaquinone biosynthesis C-methylase UbiE
LKKQKQISDDMANFKDNFSKQSDIYLKYRPHYPIELYAYLASLTNEHSLAWDCGTGNGQAAVGLTEFYDKVIATDPSEQQIKNAIPHEKITYKVEKAENSSNGSNSVDLITIANALHWFNFESFYEEANRVMKDNGIIAAWSYTLPQISPDIDKIIHRYHYQTLNDYWRWENRLVENEYADIPFPFSQINTPDFFIEKWMNLNDVIGYLNTWSATQRFINENNFNPTDTLRDEMSTLWQDANSEKKLVWKLTLKVGKLNGLDQ